MPGGNGPGGLDVGSALPGIARAPSLCTNSSPAHCPPAPAMIWAAEIGVPLHPSPPRRRAVLLAELGTHSPGSLWKTRMPRWGAGSGPQEGPRGGRVSLPPANLSQSWLSAGVGVAGLRRGGEGSLAHGGAVDAAASQASLLSVTRPSSASLHSLTAGEEARPGRFDTTPADAGASRWSQLHPVLGEGQMLLGHECTAGLG